MDEVSRQRRPARSATRHGYALLVLTVLAGCSRSPLRTAHDGAAAGGGGGENWDIPGATEASAQGGGGVATAGAAGMGTGGTLGSSAGDTGFGGTVDASSTHGAADTTGDAISMDGNTGAVQDGATSEGEIDASPDGRCDLMPLWDAIAEGADVFGYCLPYAPDYDDPCGFVRSVGYVVFDGDGRVVDNTGLFGARKQAWLDGLSTMRWPCYAGQTMQYMCIQVSDDGC